MAGQRLCLVAGRLGVMGGSRKTRTQELFKMSSSSGPPKVQQPKPQALPSRSGPNSILVAICQKGNPILNSVKSIPWEYSDTPADYVLGATTCALFLSLKYHRLHPEYIYGRIRGLGGKYNLRILLTMVDIPNHEDSLRELSKTSLVNNVTIILCWSAQEAGRYLENFKIYEHAAPTAIRAPQSTAYSDKLVDFVTAPRGINKTDAVGLVSNFGSLRTAINARPEEVALVAGWGEKKVQRWCHAVREPFRPRRAARRGAGDAREEDDEATADGRARRRRQDPRLIETSTQAAAAAERRAQASGVGAGPPEVDWAPGEDEEAAMLEPKKAAPQQPATSSKRKPSSGEDELSEGVMAALAKLRKQ
ncbi:restriction endonuclease type II-like protein [Lineolata rhizophorae]|uniref:Restriction endonuclease type II-like protein n=1 Tax=Lineolata rhizophorae TaxID=578093 RepID=A0A6A6PAN8_9PEZI|nr:restriction endonuclease type II-like protein [Lineolata rhizophorae]